MSVSRAGDPPPVRPLCHALVPCAGVGLRAGAGGPKQYVPVAGRPMVMWTLQALASMPALAGTLVVLAPGDTVFEPLLAVEADLPGRERLSVAHCGGATRADTVLAGLAELRHSGAGADDWVLVHDAARCLIASADVQRLIDECAADPVGGLLALPVADTLKQGGSEGRVQATVDRSHKWAAQTPQMFRLGLLERALREALSRPEAAITDEASAIEALGFAPRLVRGRLDNFKLTWPEDFALAERLLASRPPTP